MSFETLTNPTVAASNVTSSTPDLSVLQSVLPDPATWLPAYLQFGKPLLTMPKGAEMFVTILFGIGSLAVAAWLISIAVKKKVTYPIWIILGGILCTHYEFFDAQTLHFQYPQNGDIHVMTLWGMSIPLYLVLIYPFYVTFLTGLIFHWFEQGKLTVKKYWIVFLIAMFGALIFEPPAIANGLWYYYGDNQPFKILGLFPFFWFIANPAMIIVIGLIAHYVWNDLLKRKHAWSIALTIPFSLFGVHVAITAPEAFAINTYATTLMPNIMGVVTCLLGFGVVYLGGKFVELQNSRRKQDVKVGEMAAVAGGRAGA